MTREIIRGAEAERIVADIECLDSPFPHEYSPGRYACDTEELKHWRETRYKLIGYAPGQGPV